MNIEYAVILVDSTSQAIQIEKILNRQKLSCKLIPVPRHLSSDCGTSVRILKRDTEEIRTLTVEHHLQIRSIEEL